MNFCLNSIKIGLKQNKKGCIIKNNKKNLNILKALLKINILKFIKIKNKNIIVYLNYHNNKPIFKNILNLLKPSCKKFISLKKLKKINVKFNWILIISTSKGILNNLEAVKLKTGGLLIAKIWN